MKMRWLQLLAAAVVLGIGDAAHAGSADEDWEGIAALDAGPREQPKDREAIGAMLIAHLARQEKALRSFLAEHPQDARAFEARVRLARLFEIRADLEGSEKLRAEAKRMLDELEKSATPEQRPELDFANVARLMRGLRSPNVAQREELLRAARQFQAAHPADRRVASLLTEVATLFDYQPRTKEILLEDARAAATDEELKGRIADDLKRVRLVGQEVPLRFTSVQGEEIRPDGWHGRPAFVIFFADFSPPSLAALARLQEQVAQLPKGSVRVFGVCLDEKPEDLSALLKKRGLAWPVACDGRGWESPLVREFGINALPTVWLLDARGRLRSLDALEGADIKARQLLRER